MVVWLVELPWGGGVGGVCFRVGMWIVMSILWSRALSRAGAACRRGGEPGKV